MASTIKSGPRVASPSTPGLHVASTLKSGLQMGRPATLGLGAASLNQHSQMASSKSVASSDDDDGLGVASSNFKVGSHTDTTKYGLCASWLKFGLDAKSG